MLPRIIPGSAKERKGTRREEVSVLRRGDPERGDQVSILLQRPPGRPRRRDAATAGAGRSLGRGADSVQDIPSVGHRHPADGDGRRVVSFVRAVHALGLPLRARLRSGPLRDLGAAGPGSPVEQFPRTDEGWRSALIRFVNLEPNHVPVGSEQGTSSSGGASPKPGMQPPGNRPGTDLSDNQLLQYTHSGSTYLLG